MADAPVYILIGATGGIGSEVAQRLADDGAQLVLAARSASDLDELAEATGGDARPTDATDLGAVQELIDYTTDTYGRLDGVLNAVGSILLKPAHLTSEDEYREQLRLNLDTAFFTVKTAARAMASAD